MRKLFLSLLAACFLVDPAFAGSMNAAVSSLVQQKVAQRSYGVASGTAPTKAQVNAFAANDPRFVATVDALSTAATVVAVGAGGAVVVGSSVAWLPLLTAAGISALVTGAVSLAVGGIKQWLFNSDGTVTVTGGVSLPAGSLPMVAGGGYWAMGYGYAAGDAMTVITAYQKNLYPDRSTLSKCVTDNTMNPPYSECIGRRADGTGAYRFSTTFVATGAPSTCAAGSYSVNGTCAALPGTSTTVTGTAASQVPSVPASDLEKPANPVIVAQAANLLWQKATAANPNIIPFDAANPITEADVNAWSAANPGAMPTAGDLVGPASSAGTSTVSMPVPGVDAGTATQAQPGTATGTATNTATGQNIDLKIEWGTFSPPAIETPSIESILDPLFNMWPEWKNFAFPEHTATCPTPSYQLPSGVMGGRTIHFAEMCSFLDQSGTRQAMQAAFAVAWSMNVFIVMGA